MEEYQSDRICSKCGGTIIQSGGDSRGFIFFKCKCSEWISKETGWPFRSEHGEIKRIIEG